MSKRARKPEPAWLQHVGHALFVALFLFCCYHSVDWIWTGQMYCVPLYTGNAPFYVTWPDSPFSFVLGLIFLASDGDVFAGIVRRDGMQMRNPTQLLTLCGRHQDCL
jgi:hypothetical protein